MYGIGGGVSGAGITVLASTGVSTAAPFIVGIALVVAGMIALRVARRRSARREAGRG